MFHVYLTLVFSNKKFVQRGFTHHAVVTSPSPLNWTKDCCVALLQLKVTGDV